MPAGVGYDAAMACDFGLLHVMKMIESAAGYVNFFWGGLRNSSNSLHPQCSILPRLMAQILCTSRHGLQMEEATRPHLKTRFRVHDAEEHLPTPVTEIQPRRRLALLHAFNTSAIRN